MSEGWSEGVILVSTVLAWVIIGTGVAQNAVYLFQLLIAGVAFIRQPPVIRSHLLWHRYSEVAPPIAVIVPCYNEAMNVVESVYSLLALHYPDFEVIVVNDGSKDETLTCLVEAFDLVPYRRPFEEALAHRPIRGVYSSPRNERLVVVDKENGGKADAQNAGINVSRAPVFCVIDGDSILEPDALMRAAKPFIDDPERVIAVGGTIRIANGSVIADGRVKDVRLPRQILPLFQIIEYLRVFLVARLAWSRFNSLMLVSGAFGMFRRDVVVAVGGFKKGSLGEDLDLVIKLHRYMIEAGRNYRIEFVPEPVCWTEAPSTLGVLARQRTRWQRGALEVFFRYRSMVLNPRYGRIGLLGFGNMLMMDVIGPFVELLGYGLMPLFWALGILSFDYVLAFMALVFAYGVVISVCSLVLEEAGLKRFRRPRDLAILTALAVVENFGYRQINNYWRLKGCWQYWRGDTGWGEMTRTGFSAPKTRE